MALKRNLLILNDRIFDSKVDGGMPRAVAAPAGPDTLPLVFAKAASITSFSGAANISADGWFAG